MGKISMFSVIVSLIVEFAPGHANVLLELVSEKIRIGRTMAISCTVNGIDQIDSTLTRQWFKEGCLISYNSHSNHPNKYTEILTSGNKFILEIRNVTESDVNCIYRCRYGFQSHESRITLSQDNFEYPSTENTTEFDYNYTMNGRFNVNVHMDKVFPLPNCTILFEDFSLRLTEINHKKNGLYFEVNLIHESYITFKSSTRFNVTCKFQQVYFIADGQIIVHTDRGDIQGTDGDEFSILAYTLLVLLALTLLAGVFYFIYIKICRTKQDNSKEMEKGDLPEITIDIDICSMEKDNLMTELSEKMVLIFNHKC